MVMFVTHTLPCGAVQVLPLHLMGPAQAGDPTVQGAASKQPSSTAAVLCIRLGWPLAQAVAISRPAQLSNTLELAADAALRSGMQDGGASCIVGVTIQLYVEW
jgi:hypothetical protein